MWNIDCDSSVVQLELGDNAITAYSSSKKKKTCDILINQIGELRAQLSEQNIFLPYINIRDSQTLPANMFDVYFGAFRFNGDIRTDNILQILANQAFAHHLDDYSYNGLLKVFESGVDCLREGNYQKAIYDFAKSYYNSAFDGAARNIMINSMINICGIEFINQRYESALLSGRRACILAMADSFYDPYLKYYAAAWTGIVYRQMNNLKQAIRHFESAYQVLEQMNENCLKISALSTLAQLHMDAGNYRYSANLMDGILDLLQADDSLNVDKDFLIKMASFQSQVQKAIIQDITEKYGQLQRQYAKLSSKFLPQLGSLAINILCKIGPTIIPCLIGSLMKSNNQIQFGSNNIISGENTIVVSAQ